MRCHFKCIFFSFLFSGVWFSLQPVDPSSFFGRHFCFAFSRSTLSAFHAPTVRRSILCSCATWNFHAGACVLKRQGQTETEWVCDCAAFSVYICLLRSSHLKIAVAPLRFHVFSFSLIHACLCFHLTITVPSRLSPFFQYELLNKRFAVVFFSAFHVVHYHCLTQSCPPDTRKCAVRSSRNQGRLTCCTVSCGA